ncbi:alkylation response protein AidB-like acyl-CoA dehydrogenase [Streptomyces sp. MJP52]|nr:alkylation response protein AidB-like acyl-CoA dehydrogenase [Streptomyces sp. MJP52]
MTDASDLRRRTQELLAAHPPATTDRKAFLEARFDAGLAWVHFPEGLGGLGLPRTLQSVVEAELAAAGAPDNDPRRIGIGLGMAAPTILQYGTEEQKHRFSCARCGSARRSGASSSASPAPAPTWPPSAPARSRTATTGWSTARRCGPPAPTSPAGPS